MTVTLIPFFVLSLLGLLHSAEHALGRLAGHWRRHAERWKRHRQARATVLAMDALDDRALRDLGLYRSELPSVAVHPADPSRARNGRIG